MQVEGFGVVLRPRSMAEAADLGSALVREYRASIWRCYTPVLLGVLLLALATIEIRPWLPALVVFWLKPWLDRTLLFVLSRAVFGEATRWADVWRDRAAIWWPQLPSTLTLRRLSPWRSYTQPLSQLERQRGKLLRTRRDVVLKGKRGAAMGMQMIFANAEFALGAGLFSLMVWFAPEGLHTTALGMLASDNIAWQAVSTIAYACIVLAIEPFFVAAGFAMYLNRRVELEAWDVEQEFRRAFAR